MLEKFILSHVYTTIYRKPCIFQSPTPSDPEAASQGVRDDAAELLQSLVAENLLQQPSHAEPRPIATPMKSLLCKRKHVDVVDLECDSDTEDLRMLTPKQSAKDLLKGTSLDSGGT